MLLLTNFQLVNAPTCVGLDLSSPSLNPNEPYWPTPQVHNVPSGLIPPPKPVPEAMLLQGRTVEPAPTCAGLDRYTRSFCPNWPLLFLPQDHRYISGGGGGLTMLIPPEKFQPPVIVHPIILALSILYVVYCIYLVLV